MLARRSPRPPILVSLLVAVVLAVAALPELARAHGAGIPWIYVEAEQVWPGQDFHVLVLDVAPYVTVRLEAELGDASATLGEVPTGPQGHGETDVSLPADFPFGHATLRGVGDDGSEVSTPLRVGDVPAIDAPPGPQRPPAQASGSPLTDPSLWTLGLMLAAGLLALVWIALQRRRAPRPELAGTAMSARSAAPERVRRPRKQGSRRRS